MTPKLMEYLCEPISKEPLKLVEEKLDLNGNIKSGLLLSPSGKCYPIVNGIPRFVEQVSNTTVKSFGDEWNHFNFTEFKVNWLEHTVFNTFGNTGVFNGRLIVDAGGGSGAQTKWFAEYGADHVILMDLSHSVDDVVQRNLLGLKNVDVIQCSIDAPPLRDQSINGIVYCHNVIQHTPSVEKTAYALYSLVASGGEFVFNCYPLNDKGFFRWVRHHLIYKSLRSVLSFMPFACIMFYSRVMAMLRLLPILGVFFEKFGFCVMGDIPKLQKESYLKNLVRRYKSTCLNTFDCFGSHKYQHLKSDEEILSLINNLQPDKTKILNIEKYFLRPMPIGCALRIFK